MVDRALSDIAVTVDNVIEDSLALNLITVSFSSNSGAENAYDVPCFLSAEEALELTRPFHHAIVGGTIALIRVLVVGAYAVEQASTNCYELYKDIKTHKLQLSKQKTKPFVFGF